MPPHCLKSYPHVGANSLLWPETRVALHRSTQVGLVRPVKLRAKLVFGLPAPACTPPAPTGPPALLVVAAEVVEAFDSLQGEWY